MTDHFESRAGRLAMPRCLDVPLWLFFVHFATAPVLRSYWGFLVTGKDCSSGLHVTVEFWFGFVSLCLGIYVCAAWRALCGLWRDRDAGIVRDWRALGPGLVVSSIILYSPLTIVVSIFFLSTCGGKYADQILGQGDLTRAGLVLLALVCCFLAVAMPGLASWFSLHSVARSRSWGESIWRLLAWSAGCFYGWLLCVGPLRCLGAFPLPQMMVAVLIAAIAGRQAGRDREPRWGYATVALLAGLMLVFLASIGFAGTYTLPLLMTILGLTAAPIGFLYPRQSVDSDWGGSWARFFVLVTLEAGMAVLSWLWILSAFVVETYDWRVLGHILASPLTWLGLAWVSLWACVRVMIRA